MTEGKKEMDYMFSIDFNCSMFVNSYLVFAECEAFTVEAFDVFCYSKRLKHCA